ncbi:glycosyltransferase family 2 protein [Terriglobus saanensis]|nr:glycosyltransferase family 2 protein [Terriglobus saanensis]
MFLGIRKTFDPLGICRCEKQLWIPSAQGIQATAFVIREMEHERIRLAGAHIHRQEKLMSGNTVSVCIPTRHRSDLLTEAILSCLAQTRLPDAILIADDSEDSVTEETVAKLQETTPVPIQYRRNSPPLGQNENTNSLFDRATTTHLILLHDDDWLLPNAIGDLLNCWMEYPNLTAAYGKQYVASHDGTIDVSRSHGLNTAYHRTSERAGLQPRSWEVGILQQFPNDCYMVKSDVARAVRWRAVSEVGDGGDFDFGLRMGLQNDGFFFLDTYTAKYRETASGSISASDSSDTALSSYRVLRQMNLPEGAEKLRDLKMKNLAPRAMMQAIKLGRKKEAAQIYFSKHHGRRAFTLGGIRRLLLLLS